MEKRKKLTREEIWSAITDKYHHLRFFTTEGSYRDRGGYVKREYLFNLMLEMKIHKSRHLTKEQKLSVFEEIEQNKLNAITEKL